MVALNRLVRQLRNDSISPEELVEALDQLNGHYGCVNMEPDFWSTMGQPKKLKDFVATGAVADVVKIAMTGWPADGNLANSNHRYDIVKDVGDAATDWEVDYKEADMWEQGLDGKRPGPKWRSPRRKAIMFLQDMAHYGAYVAKMEDAGLFGPQGLCAMLESSLAHIDFSVHNKGWEFNFCKDQTQAVVVCLLNLASCAVRSVPSFIQQCKQHTAMTICRHYKSPYTLLVDKCHRDHEQHAAMRRAQGWSEERVAKAVSILKNVQHEQEINTFGKDKYFFENGGLDNNFCLFFIHFLNSCRDEDVLLKLIHEGGLIQHLKGNNSLFKPNTDIEGPTGPVATLAAVWTKKAASVSKDLFQRMVQGEETKSAELRQQGNDAFRSGDLQQALGLYWQAVEKNPQDYALFNNISLVALKLGDVKQAYQAADESLKLSPVVHKSWCRLGDALRAVDRWQLAHLAYTCALELSPIDQDIRVRQDEARRHLFEVWTVDNIPAVYVHEVQRPRLIQKEVLAGNAACLQWLRTTAGEVDQIRANAAELVRERPAAAEMGQTETEIHLANVRFGADSRFWVLAHL